MRRVAEHMQDTLINCAPENGWQCADEQRLMPLPRAEMNCLQLGLVKHLVRRHRVPARNLFSSLLHAPRIFLAWLPFAAQLMPYGTLSRRQTELVILRTAWCCRCQYEWVQHVQIGRAQGLSDEEMARVTVGSGAAGWTSLEVALLRAVDDVVETGVISASVWTALADQLSAKQLIETAMLIGHYRMLASVIDSLGVRVE